MKKEDGVVFVHGHRRRGGKRGKRKRAHKMNHEINEWGPELISARPILPAN